MKIQELESFYNAGFGWVCKNCEDKLKNDTEQKARLMTEGEAESKNPEFSNKAMAKWMDAEQNTLICPHCEIEEHLL